MAVKKRILDVWIVELNTVYKDVPYGVITDWLQQGRLLAEDKVRLAGTTAWHTISKVQALAAFLPQAEPFRADDKAEALEPVEVGFAWTAKAEEEDEDVDMIPLIDISLVLLIFFMMTASISAGIFSNINTPGAKHQLAAINQDMYWLGIDVNNPEGKIDKGPDGKATPWYSLGLDNQLLHKPNRDAGKVIHHLAGLLSEAESRLDAGALRPMEARVRIRADRSLPIEIIKGMTIALQETEAGFKGKVKIVIAGEVSEPGGK